MIKNEINVEILKIVKKYINEVSKKFNIESVYIFGSYAKGTENEDSDIDVAIVLDSDNLFKGYHYLLVFLILYKAGVILNKTYF